MSNKYSKPSSLRLRNYDYSKKGHYLITIYTHRRQALFGQVVREQVRLNTFGKIAHQAWAETQLVRPHVGVGAFVVMPDSIHALISINQYLGEANRPRIGKFISPTQTIGAMVRGYKGVVTKRIRALTKIIGPEFLPAVHLEVLASIQVGHPIWQCNYHDWIINKREDYFKASNYIWNKPLELPQ
jgi:hypothetical protein